MKSHLIITITSFVMALYLCVPSSDKPAHVGPIVEVQPEQETEPVKTALIEMQLADWCGPCRKFKASGAIKELEAAGWTVEYKSGLSKSYPSFRIWVDGKSSTFSGYSNKTNFFRTLKKRIEDLKDNQ